MDFIEQRFTVPYRYTVHLTENAFALDNDRLAQSVGTGENTPRALTVIDGGVLAAQQGLLPRIERYFAHYHIAHVLPPLVLPGGERVKNEAHYLQRILATIERANLCRHSYVIGIGGGALLDLVGYAAALAHRGVRHVRMPTTVLSQCDSGVGVKNGVNYLGKKNFLGSFAPPWAVINDLQFLTTLPDRDWRAGMAEAVKVALIKDPAFFAQLERDADALVARDMTAMRRLIRRSAELHLQHIAQNGDPFELGSARPLDFGHWAAHKLEQLTQFELRHGEAVAIGMALDATFAHLSGWLDADSLKRVVDLLLALGFTLHTPSLSAYWNDLRDPRCVWAGVDEFRAHLGGQLNITMLDGIGKSHEVHALDPTTVRAAVECLARGCEEYRPRSVRAL